MRAKIKERLLKLADHLDTLDQSHFDMERYMKIKGYGDCGLVVNKHDLKSAETRNPCGTVCCAVGEAVLIRKKLGLKLQLCYRSDNIYWISIGTTLAGGSYDMSVWLFGADWRYTDNTPKGTANRIRWTCEHGLPDNYQDQMKGQAGLCYVHTLTHTHTRSDQSESR